MKGLQTVMLAVGSTVVCLETDKKGKKASNMIIGMSMRLAFDLGLHLDTTSYVEKGDISAFEADVRRVAFWGSYTADQ